MCGFWSLMKSPLFSVPIAPVFPESINEQFPLIHLSGLIHVFIFVSGPEDESLAGGGRAALLQFPLIHLRIRLHSQT